MRFEYRFSIIDGRVRFGGLDWGYGDSQPYLIDRTENYLVMRVPGRVNWKALGTFGYTAATWILISYQRIASRRTPLRGKNDPPRQPTYQSLERIEELEPGRKWRACRDKLVKRMHALEKAHGR